MALDIGSRFGQSALVQRNGEVGRTARFLVLALAAALGWFAGWMLTASVIFGILYVVGSETGEQQVLPGLIAAGGSMVGVVLGVRGGRTVLSRVAVRRATIDDAKLPIWAMLMRHRSAASTDDWRLFGQDKYLLGARLKWMTWRPSQPDWDHDHCSFCMAKISDRPVDGDTEYNAALVTSNDEYHWVCPVCFEDFHESFRWTVDPDE